MFMDAAGDFPFFILFDNKPNIELLCLHLKSDFLSLFAKELHYCPIILYNILYKSLCVRTITASQGSWCWSQ